MQSNTRSGADLSFTARLRPLAAAALTCALLIALPAARAQDCDGPTWSTNFTSGRFDNTPHCLRAVGGDLLAGGRFTTVGGQAVSGVARWDGQAWQPMGDGLTWRVRVLEELPADPGPVLYALGSLIDGGADGGARAARWGGESWTTIAEGPDGGIFSATVFDDGSGPALYCAGSFTQIEGIAAIGIARFDGLAWSTVGSGVAGRANAVAVFDDGSGPALYVGGQFASAGGVPAKNLARWDGAGWSEVGGGIDSGFGTSVRTLSVNSSGGKPVLYVGGYFFTVGDGIKSRNSAGWDGSEWLPLVGTKFPIDEMADVDSGQGRRLYASAPEDAHILVLDGSQWIPLDPPTKGGVRALVEQEYNGSPALHIAADGLVYVRHDDAWLAFGDGFVDQITAMLELDRGQGPEILVSGPFDQVAGMKIGPGFAVWDGNDWEPFPGADALGASKLVVFDDGNGPTIYAAMPSDLSRVQRLAGDQWLPAGQFSEASGSDLVVFDDGSGPALYSCGGSDYEAGLFGVVRLEDSAWVQVGQGLNWGDVHSLAVYDDGSGPALYAAGDFERSGDAHITGIARWTGAEWAPLGTGLPTDNNTRRTLAVFDDGGGPALYVSGGFDQAGGVPARNIARWDGQQWSALDKGVAGSIRCMAAYRDDAGPALYVSGDVQPVGGLPVSGLAKWTQTGWQPVGAGLLPESYNSGFANAMLPSSFDGGSLFLGGAFDTADGVSSGNIAQLIACPACPADLDHDGALTLFDFLAFLNAFNANNPAADCDHSQSLDLFDFLCFTNSFNTGC